MSTSNGTLAVRTVKSLLFGLGPFGDESLIQVLKLNNRDAGYALEDTRLLLYFLQVIIGYSSYFHCVA